MSSPFRPVETDRPPRATAAVALLSWVLGVVWWVAAGVALVVAVLTLVLYRGLSDIDILGTVGIALSMAGFLYLFAFGRTYGLTVRRWQLGVAAVGLGVMVSSAPWTLRWFPDQPTPTCPYVIGITTSTRPHPTMCGTERQYDLVAGAEQRFQAGLALTVFVVLGSFGINNGRRLSRW
jgi:hypothetical protein